MKAKRKANKRIAMKIKSLIIIIFSAFAIGTAVTGCSPAKYCAEPDLKLPDAFGPGATDSVTIADLEWWNLYTDTLLQSLIRQALEYNKDMLIAAERIEQMRQLHRMDKAKLFPDIGVRAGFNDEFTNYGGNSPDPGVEFKMPQATFSWEIDLWGNLRWANKKAAAEYLETVEAKRAMQMSLIASVATSYYELMALDNELRIVTRTLTTRQEGVHQARVRFEGGLTSETSYQQAEVELATTESLIPDLEREIAIKESEIALLTGQYPYNIRRAMIDVKPSLNKDNIPIGVPSYLLLRRPDIRMSEKRLMAAMADVGIAQAERFPRFTINFTGGFESDDILSIFRSPYYYPIINLAAPLFSFNKRKAKFKASIAAYNQARLEHEKTVMSAFKEVHDAVITYRSACENSVLKQNLLDASKKYMDLARLQYLNGVINYLDVLDAQRIYFDAQVELSNAVSNEYLALVDLYKALGGGWSVSDVEISEEERVEKGNVAKREGVAEEKQAKKDERIAEKQARKEARSVRTVAKQEAKQARQETRLLERKAGVEVRQAERQSKRAARQAMEESAAL